MAYYDDYNKKPQQRLSTRANTVRPSGGIMDARTNLQRGKSFTVPNQNLYTRAPGMNLGSGLAGVGAAQQMWNNPNVQRNNQNVENSLANMGGKTGIFGTPNNSVDLAGAASNFGGKALDFFIPKAYGADQPQGGGVLQQGNPQEIGRLADRKEALAKQFGYPGAVSEGEQNAINLSRQPNTQGIFPSLSSDYDRYYQGGSGQFGAAFNALGNFAHRNITQPIADANNATGRAILDLGREAFGGNTSVGEKRNVPQSQEAIKTTGQPPVSNPTLLEQTQGQINPEQAAELRGQQQGLPVPQAQSEFNQFGYHSSDPMSLLSNEQLANMAMRKDLMTQQDLIQSDRDAHNFNEYGVTPDGAPLPMPRQGLQNYYGQQEVDLQRQKLGIDQQLADTQEAGMYAPQQPVMQTVQDSDGMEHVISFDPVTGQRTNAAKINAYIRELHKAKGTDESIYKQLLSRFQQELPYDYNIFVSQFSE